VVKKESNFSSFEENYRRELRNAFSGFFHFPHSTYIKKARKNRNKIFWFLPSAVRIREEKEAVFSNLK
jgi:hypothetical protein